MTERHDRALEALDRADERRARVLGHLVATASADRVFGEPVVAGQRTLIPAAEVRTGLGFGHGLLSGGRGPGRTASKSRGEESVVARGRGGLPPGSDGPQGGGGGGGQAGGRPVAVITMDPDGVHVQPVVDRTKIVVTALAALGAIAMTLLKLRRAGNRVR